MCNGKAIYIARNIIMVKNKASLKLNNASTDKDEKEYEEH